MIIHPVLNDGVFLARNLENIRERACPFEIGIYWGLLLPSLFY